MSPLLTDFYTLGVLLENDISEMNSLNCSFNENQYVSGPSSPCFLYGSETWSIGVRLPSRLNYFTPQALRKIMGYRWDNLLTNFFCIMQWIEKNPSNFLKIGLRRREKPIEQARSTDPCVNSLKQPPTPMRASKQFN